MGVLINETCYKTGRVSTPDFTVYAGGDHASVIFHLFKLAKKNQRKLTL